MKKKCKAKVMVEVLGSLLLGTILLTTIMAHTPALAQLSNYNPQGLKAGTLEEVLALPDEEIDLASAIMILYKEWDPSFDATGSSEEIQRMAVELERRINPEDSPEKIVSLINQYVFEKSAYSALEPTDPGYMKDLERSALPRVIERKKGDCLGLCLLYLALAERLGLPFHGVAAPGHVFVRYDDGKTRINVETTNKGAEYEDSQYEKDFMLHPAYKRHNWYLENLLKREVIGVFLNGVAITYGRKGMYNQAIVKLKKALEINPNDPAAHSNLGVVYGDKGMLDEAIVEHEKAIEANPNYAEAHGNLGIAYAEKGMLDEAITELRKTVELGPSDVKAHYNLGVVYGEKGMLDQAIVELRKTLDIDPNYPEAHYMLGLAYDHKGMYGESIAELTAALEANPNHAEAHFSLGVAYDREGMLDKALAEYKKAIEANPNYAEAHYGLGEAYGRRIMLDEAITEYKRVLEIDPNHGMAHNNLAVLYYVQGEHSLAIEHCDRAIELGYWVHPEFLEDLEPYREK